MTTDDAAAPEPARPGRPRNAEATRAAILDAARRAFTDAGYDQVGVREIAAAAGIDPALVIRYFGSKAGLFAEALGKKFDLSHVFAGDMDEFGERLARYVLNKPPGSEHFDPMLAMLRSAPGKESGLLIRTAIDDGFVSPLAARLEGPDRDLRAGLIGAILIGVLVNRTLIRSGALAAADNAHLIGVLAPVIQEIVDRR